jgi:hypothetical protein
LLLKGTELQQNRVGRRNKGFFVFAHFYLAQFYGEEDGYQGYHNQQDFPSLEKEVNDFIHI